jgi:hypothetical protein
MGNADRGCEIFANLFRETKDIADDLFSELDEKDSDYRFILHLMQHIDKPIHLAVRENLVSKSYFGKHFEFPPINLVFLDLVGDADRLGRKCVIEAPEVVPSRRIIRALGLAVLGVAEQIRSRESGGWCAAIELSRSLLSVADLRNNIQWTSDGNGMVRSDFVPEFLIQSCERLSPRFGRGYSTAFARLKACFPDNTVSCIKLRPHGSLDAIFAYLQQDLVQWELRRSENVSGLANPSVNVRYLGPHG